MKKKKKKEETMALSIAYHSSFCLDSRSCATSFLQIEMRVHNFKHVQGNVIELGHRLDHKRDDIATRLVVGAQVAGDANKQALPGNKGKRANTV